MVLQSKNNSLGTFPALSSKLRSTNTTLLLDSLDFYRHRESETPWLHKAGSHSHLRMAVAAGAQVENRLWTEAALQMCLFPLTSSMNIHESGQ